MVVASLAGSILIVGFALFAAVQDRTWIPVFAVLVIASVVLNLAIILLNLLRAKLNDASYAVSLEAGLLRAAYHPLDFFTDGAAASPSLQLLHLKILRFCKPQRILELGSGQTTKILSCYARENPSAYILTLEQDGSWVQRLREHVVHDYRHAPLLGLQFSCSGFNLDLSTMWYQEVPELLEGQFDYVLIDGPDPGTPGTTHNNYSRSGILKYLPSILAESFVVLFDDAERYGEIMTIRAFESVLKASKVKYVRFSIHGVKSQVVFCSENRSYLRSS